MKLRQAIKKAVALGTGALMLGATILGASAANLSDYPNMFIDDGKVNAKIVVGEKAATIDVVGAIDIAGDLQAKAVSTEAVSVTGTGVTVSGGKTKEVALGTTLGATEFTSSLTDSSIPSLKDEKITWNDKDIDIDETLNVAAMQVYTTSKDKDFGANPYLGTPTSNAIQYRYVIDDSDLDVSAISTTEPLKVEILGKALEITDVTSGSTVDEITLNVASEYYLAIGDSVEVSGKTVTLKNVGNGNNVVVDVDGTIKTVDADTGSEKVNGIRIEVDSAFYVDATEERSATLKIGDKITDTVKDGDPMEFFGEPSKAADAEWVWVITADPATSNTTMTLGANFNQNYDSDKEPVTGIGEKFNLPENYASIYMDSLTASADAEIKLTFDDSVKVVTNETGGTGNIASLDDQKALVFTADKEIFQVNVSGVLTDASTVYLIENNSAVMVGFENSDGDLQLATGTDAAEANATDPEEAIKIDYENTELSIYYGASSADANVTFVGELTIAGTDWISLDADIAAKYFGGDDTGYEAADYTTSLSSVNKENDYLTDWGIIISNPEDGFDSEEFTMTIPPEQVKANVVVVGSDATVSSGGSSVTTQKVNAIGVDFGVLDKDAPAAGTTNLIIVGGPCVNTEAARVMGNPADCAEGFEEGTAKLALFDDDGKVALLVAGYSGDDTLSATRALITEVLPEKSDAKVITTNAKSPSVE